MEGHPFFATIDERFGEQKSVALSRIEEVREPVSHDDLKETIDSVLGFG